MPRERPPLAAMSGLASPAMASPPRPLAVYAPPVEWVANGRDRALPVPHHIGTTAATPSMPAAESAGPAAREEDPVDTGDARVDEPPVETTLLRPRYPAVALRRKREGTVVVELVVNRQGEVEDARIVRVEGHPAFAQSVLDIAEKWRFRPALSRGQPVRVRAMKTLHFKLDEQ